MTIIPASLPASFSAQFSAATPAYVAMSIYDDSGASPVLTQGPALMANVVSNIYRGKFTPTAGKTYVAVMAVYTDGTFTTIDTAFTEVTQTFMAQNLPVPQSVTGVVNCEGN